MKSRRPLRHLVSAAALWALVLGAGSGWAGPGANLNDPGLGTPPDYVPPQLQNVGVVEHLGGAVPRDVPLRDEAGRPVHSGDFFGRGRPVMINFVYHSCPMLCGFVQTGFEASLKQLPWSIGADFEVLTISIDERDTPAIAAEKKAHYVAEYGRNRRETELGWHFLTGKNEDVKRLAEAVGFSYYYDSNTKQFAHSAALFVLTPDATMARYLYGIEFPAKDLRLSLAEAAEGRSIGTIDHLLLYCYHYDPNARGYVLMAERVMRLGAAATAVGLFAMLGVLWWRERRKAKADDDAARRDANGPPRLGPPTPPDLHPNAQG